MQHCCCRFETSLGNTVLGGAAASANLSAGGRAFVEANIFAGDGAPMAGIDTDDLQWEFSGNIFEDGITHNSREDADSYLTALETVTITTAGVYVAIGGVNWASDIAHRFTVTTGGEIEYIGLSGADVDISAYSTIAKIGGGSDKLSTKIAIDTGSGYVVQDKTTGSTKSTDEAQVTSAGLFQLSTGDKIQIFIANEGGTANIEVSNSEVIVRGV